MAEFRFEVYGECGSALGTVEVIASTLAEANREMERLGYTNSHGGWME